MKHLLAIFSLLVSTNAFSREQMYFEGAYGDGDGGGLIFVFMSAIGYVFWEILKGGGSFGEISKWKRVAFVAGCCTAMYVFPIIFYVISLLMCIAIIWEFIVH